jgi:hypothetical protein
MACKEKNYNLTKKISLHTQRSPSKTSYFLHSLHYYHLQITCVFFFCFLDRAFFNGEENNQQNALINSSINLLMSDHSDMFRLPS